MVELLKLKFPCPVDFCMLVSWIHPLDADRSCDIDCPVHFLKVSRVPVIMQERHHGHTVLNIEFSDCFICR